MIKPKSISFILSTRGLIPSVNSLYKAKLEYKYGRPIPIIYKSSDAKKIIEELEEQLRMIDFSKESWMFDKDAIFDLNIQLIFKQSFFRRDTDNTLKLIQDAIFKHLELNDSRVVSICATKAVCSEFNDEKICVNISQSTKEIQFSKLEDLPSPQMIYLQNEKFKDPLIKMGYKLFSDNLDECDCAIFSFDSEITPEEAAKVVELSYQTKLNGKGSILVGVNNIPFLVDSIGKISNSSKRVWCGSNEELLSHLGKPKRNKKQ